MRRHARVVGLIALCFVGGSIAGAATGRTYPSVEEFGPTWSPNGKQIAFVRARRVPGEYGFRSARIAVARSDGSNRRLLTGEGAWSFEPTWSPSGRGIAYVRIPKSSDAASQLYAVSPSRPRPAPLVQGAESARYMRLSWSPDGRALAVAVAGEGIWVAPRQQSGHLGAWHQVTSSGHDPTWSPDGTRIAYITQGAVSTIEPDGGNERVVTAHATICGSVCSSLSDPTWSPDSKRIAFTVAHKGGDQNRSTIEIVGGDGGEPVIVHVDRCCFQDLAWSPGGKHIAFAKLGGGIYVMSPDGSHVRALHTKPR